MHTSTKKWLFIKFSSIVLIPFMTWFILNFTKIYDNDYQRVVEFFFTSTFTNPILSICCNCLLFSALTISEIFEDYIGNDKIKNVANKILNIFAIVIPLVTIIGILRL